MKNLGCVKKNIGFEPQTLMESASKELCNFPYVIESVIDRFASRLTYHLDNPWQDCWTARFSGKAKIKETSKTRLDPGTLRPVLFTCVLF